MPGDHIGRNIAIPATLALVYIFLLNKMFLSKLTVLGRAHIKLGYFYNIL